MKSLWIVIIMVFLAGSCNKDSDDIRIFNYEGTYTCKSISQSWYEIPEIDSTYYWTDTASVVLEIKKGDFPDEVIIPLPLPIGTISVKVNNSGKFSHSGAPPNIGTYFTSGVFIDSDSLSIKSSGWVDEHYFNEIIWVGRKTPGNRFISPKPHSL
jgi:hypothetical protein